ncbi:SMC-Scp complex subunit ScpB [Candidatus Parcubacteria bacterium]|jgi:segregation and condensation protein B|nr:SMC-Scp complex subunit ScpB [Candidatus Parcubacteria bacterium]MBT7227901.1 SMC-Scp complex subunit ScpB [Candidatus Parcubacteria bacterium]
MSNKSSALESLLLVAGKPLTTKELASFLSVDEDKIKSLVAELQEKLNTLESGVHIAINNNKIRLISNPDNAKILQEYYKEELTSELTKPSLETLTIIAYRQPISKEELEQIRGVNCSLILRNLLIRGFVETRDDKDSLATTYSITMDFLRHLGIDSVTELPDFEKLNSDDNLNKLLDNTAEAQEEKRLEKEEK